MSVLSRIGLLTAVAASALVLAACGVDANEAVGQSAVAGTPSSPRTIDIAMTGLAFEPANIDVSEGETIRFVFTNEDSIRHEAVLGDEDVQEEHEVEMADMGGMDMGSMDMDGADEPPSVVVEPATSGDLVVTFDQAGKTVIGCHEPGHWTGGCDSTSPSRSGRRRPDPAATVEMGVGQRRSSGSPAATHASMPPARSTTLVYPRSTSVRAAVADMFPERQ